MNEGFVPTPPQLAQEVCAETLRALRGRARPRVLDPACGDGAFLLAAAECLGAGAGQAGRERLVREQLFGVDIDPGLVAATKTRLCDWALGSGASKRRRAELEQALEGSLRVGCALSGSLPGDPDWGSPPPDAPAEPLRWVQAFPWLATQGFDLVIGNPPFLDSEYLTARRPAWRKWLRERYTCARGNWDLFCPFVERSCALTASRGVQAFVAPNALAGAGYATQVRALLAGELNLQVVGDASAGSAFRDQGVYPLYYVVRKEEPAAAPVRLRGAGGVCAEIPRRYFGSQPWPLAAAVRAQELGLLDLGQGLPALESLAQVRGAATVGEAYVWRDVLQDDPRARGGALRLVNSGTIDPHRTLWGERPIRYLGRRLLHPVVPLAALDRVSPRRLEDARRDKVIVAGNTLRLEAVADPNGRYLGAKSTTVVYPRPGLSPHYVSGVLNSRVASFLYRLRFGSLALARGYLRVGPPQLRHLRVPDPQLHPDLSRRLVDEVVALREGVEPGESIERVVSRLYGVDPDLSLG